MEATGNTRSNTWYTRVVFTLNNYTQEEYDWIISQFSNCCKWLCVGKEVAPETGTPHLQGACILKKQVRRSTFANYIGFKRAWHHQMNGEPSDSQAYCMKEKVLETDFFESGEMPQNRQGTRNDLKSVVTRMLAGETVSSMIHEVDPAVAVVKFHRGLNHLESKLAKPRGEPPKIFWFWGPTGTGKTRTAYELAQHFGFGPDDIWESLESLKWFDGYAEHKYAIVDDFRARQVKNFEKFLRLLDRYPYKVPVKGDFVNWNPSVIVITCPYEPSKAFATRAEFLPEDMEQLYRRITVKGKIIQFDHELTTHERISLCTSCVFAPGMPPPSSPELELTPAKVYDLTVTHVDDSTSATEVMEQEPHVDDEEESLESYSNRMGLEQLFQAVSKRAWETDGEEGCTGSKATLEEDGYEEVPSQPLRRRLFQLPDDHEKEKEMARKGFFKKK